MDPSKIRVFYVADQPHQFLPPDLRHVPKLVYTLPVTNSDAPNGGFPRWRDLDSTQR